MSELIRLPAPRTSGELSLEAALFRRRSRRHFTPSSLSEPEISQILWAAYGYKVLPGKRQSPRGTRTCPSAGALYPLSIYLVAGNVENVEPGCYRYIPGEHELARVMLKDLRPDLFEASREQEIMLQAPAVLFYTIVYSRVSARYGERGIHRYVPMDAGHSAQNVYLQAEAMGLGTCAVGAFNDARVKSLFGLPEDEEPLYFLPIGKPSGRE